MATAPRKGFNPARKVGSAPDNGALTPYKLASGYATSLAVGDPVKLVNGLIERATNGDPAIGVFQSVRYVATNGEYKILKAWVASTVASNIEVLVMDDPAITHQVVSTGAVAGVLPGDTYAALITNADVAVGRSTIVIDATPTITGDVAVGTNLADLSAGPMSATDAFTIRTANPANSPVTITITSGMSAQDFLDLLNAVPGIVASLDASNKLVIKSGDGYGLTLASTVGTPVADLFVPTSFTNQRQTVTAGSGMVKVISVVDPENGVLEVVLEDHQLRDNA